MATKPDKSQSVPQHECTVCRAMSMGPQNSGFLSAVSASISLTRNRGPNDQEGRHPPGLR